MCTDNDIAANVNYMCSFWCHSQPRFVTENTCVCKKHVLQCIFVIGCILLHVTMTVATQDYSVLEIYSDCFVLTFKLFPLSC